MGTLTTKEADAVEAAIEDELIALRIASCAAIDLSGVEGLDGSARMRRFPPPWTVEKIPGGFKVLDANGQSLAYVYSRETPSDAQIAAVLTEDEARRIAINIAELPALLGATQESELDFPEGGG